MLYVKAVGLKAEEVEGDEVAHKCRNQAKHARGIGNDGMSERNWFIKI